MLLEDGRPAVTRARACKEMPELIVRHFLEDLPDQLRHEVDAHLGGCPGCAAKRAAIAIAADFHEARRRVGITGRSPA